MKDGIVTEVKEFETWCHNFKEAGDRIVALDASKVVVYENGKLLHTSEKACYGRYTLTVHANKAYFVNQDGTPPDYLRNLIEVDLLTFEEKTIVPNVWSYDGLPGDRSFVAVSKAGIVSASEGRVLDLKLVFPKLNPKECRWTTLLSLGRFAVLAGYSDHDIVSGSILPKKHNFLLLIDLNKLTVVNQQQPLAMEWIEAKGTSVI